MANPFDQFDAPVTAASRNPFDQFDSPAGDELADRAKAGVGGVEAAATMLGNIPATIAGGLAGLSNFVASGGDIDRARKVQDAVTDSNFGFGRAAPVTKYGKLAEQALNEGQGYIHEKAGQGGEALGGNLGRATGEFAADATMNFLPIPGGKFVGAVGKGLRREFGRTPPKSVDLSALDEAPAPAPKAEVKANPFDQFDLPLDFTEQQMAESRARDKTPGQADLFQNEGMDTIPPGNRPPINPETANYPSDAMLAQQARYRQAQATLAARQAAMEQDVGRQTGLDMGAADRARQEAAPVPGLEDAQGRALDESQQRTQPYMDERNQAPIDDNDHGYVANQYGGGQGGLRIDENGMPIRADRSMEAQNLENPLQRNLWGDELPRQSAQEAVRGITSAIDRMPPGEARQQGIGMLNGKQRGAIDLEAFTSGKKFKYVGDGTRLYFFQHPNDGPMIRAEREGKTIGELKLTTDTHFPRSDSNIEAAHVHVDPAQRGKGIAEKMYRFASEMGDVQASSTLLSPGRRMWEGFEKRGVANNEWTIPRSQRGAVDSSVLREGFRGLNRWLSKLTDQPWVKDHFPPSLYETNNDGSPKILLHGSRKGFDETPKGSSEGLHAGYAAPATMKASVTDAGKAWRVGNMEWNSHHKYGDDHSGAVYPIAVKKGNYPRLGHDYGHWDPISLARSNKFQVDLARATGRGPFEIESLMQSFAESVKNKTHILTGRNIADMFGDFLKEKLGVDGFYYPNQYESVKGKLNSYSGELKSPQRGRDLAAAMDYGDSFVTYKNSNISSLYNSPRGPARIPRSERGGIDADAIHKALQGGMDKFGKFIEDVGNTKIAPHTPQEKVVVDALGNRNYIPRGDAPADIIAAASKGQDSKGLWNNLQSGLQSAGDKVRSPLMVGVARWLSYGEKMGDRYYTQKVAPLERALKGLSSNDLIAGQAVLRKGLAEGKEYTPQQLRNAGLSDKAIAAHNQMRQAFKDALDVTNDSLRKLGRKEITPQDAYMASMWHGNWHVPIKDTSGKLAWYIKAETKAEATKAINYLRNDPELSKTLDLSGTEAKYHPENIGLKAPSDVMGAYQDMLKLFDGDTAAHMREAMNAYMEGQGYKFLQHQKHFSNKTDVRGFLGDRPWLSDKDNAMSQAKAQVSYLKEAYRWAPMQEALANVKEVLSDPDLNKSQPNNMALTKAYTAQAMGVSRNMFKGAEQAIQKAMTSGPGPLVSLLPGNIARFVGSLKNMTYLTQLGLSGGYMIATPLQSFLLGPARHLQLSGQGFGHSALQTSIKSMYDFSLGLLGHEVKNTFNSKYDLPMTPIGKAAFRYMEDNGIITQNIFHEASGLGEYAPVHAMKQAIGWTISMPEKIARAATFMSFAHHLDASGKFATQAELFRRAEELTNHTLTDFRRMSRPLAVDKMGQVGELAYTYKSPVFNQYNSLGEFARDAMKGKPGPLLAALGMTALLGGMTSLPFVNEADEAWNLVKSGVAKTWPTMYPRVAGLGIKGTIISKMNELSANDKLHAAIGAGPSQFLGDTAGYGAVSAATGSQMASRFSSSIGDISNPLGNIAPVGQEIKEWVGAGSSMANPTKNAATQAVYSAIAPPAVKGAMESHMDAFKTVKQNGGQGYANPNHLQEHSTAYVRTPDEEFKRNFGLTSLQEATTKSARYINQEESARFKQAQDVAIDKMFDAVTRKDKPDVQKYAQAYFANNGDGDGFEKELDHKLDSYMFTPEQRAIIKAQSIAAVKNVIRMRKMQGKYAN